MDSSLCNSTANCHAFIRTTLSRPIIAFAPNAQFETLFHHLLSNLHLDEFALLVGLVKSGQLDISNANLNELAESFKYFRSRYHNRSFTREQIIDKFSMYHALRVSFPDELIVNFGHNAALRENIRYMISILNSLVEKIFNIIDVDEN
jgi:hypothetical protein